MLEVSLWCCSNHGRHVCCCPVPLQDKTYRGLRSRSHTEGHWYLYRKHHSFHFRTGFWVECWLVRLWCVACWDPKPKPALSSALIDLRYQRLSICQVSADELDSLLMWWPFPPILLLRIHVLLCFYQLCMLLEKMVFQHLVYQQCVRFFMHTARTFLIIDRSVIGQTFWTGPFGFPGFCIGVIIPSVNSGGCFPVSDMLLYLVQTSTSQLLFDRLLHFYHLALILLRFILLRWMAVSLLLVVNGFCLALGCFY